MTSRQRVLASLDHCEPDRIPIDLSGHRSSGIAAIATELKREFGRDITFWGGGCDTQHVLPGHTPDQVRSHVQGQVKIFSRGGGFVFQQVHNIMADVPAENIVAMLDAVREASGQGKPAVRASLSLEPRRS